MGRTVTRTPAPNTSENLSPRENFSRPETTGNAAARSAVSVGPRAEENDLDPFSRTGFKNCNCKKTVFE